MSRIHNGKVSMREAITREALCSNCGSPADARYFDVSGVNSAPELGETVVLAEFKLPPQYCGVLEYFAQFTDLYPKDQSKIQTPGLEWLILSNGQPLFPYLPLRWIVNPWGFGSFQVAVRVDDSATLTFAVRRVAVDSSGETITTVGGRLVGRFWYNPGYGDVERRRF